MNSKARDLFVVTVAALMALPAFAHHSFALYDMEKTRTFTGVVTRVNPDANHLQIFFAEMNPERKNVIRGEDGKPIIWAIEMTGSAQAAAEGISVGTFPPGTVFSASMHPLRSGEKAGSRVGPIVKCPERKPPEATKNCDTFEGKVTIGGGALNVGG
jgi:uncharacterized protein DUF6152